MALVCAGCTASFVLGVLLTTLPVMETVEVAGSIRSLGRFVPKRLGGSKVRRGAGARRR